MNNQETCSGCKQELIGAVEVSEARVGGISVVVIGETPDRNWIACDGCNRTICKSCCLKPDSGYCDSCYFKYCIEPHLPY